MPDQLNVAVIGAGMAGVIAARRLADAGLSVTVFDKGRGLGGRLATRRIPGGSFDHGASVLHAETEAFGQVLHGTGAVENWPEAATTTVGTPAMNAPLKPLIAGLDIRYSTRVGAMWQTGGWTLTDESDATLGRFDRVIGTVPAPQARALVGGDASLSSALDSVRMAPQWSGLFGWNDAPGDDFAALHPGGALQLIARMATKPDRAGPMDCWVAHASPDWTRAHLDADPAAIPGLLLAEVEVVLGRLPKPDYATAHRWLYSRTEVPLGHPYLSSADGTLLLGGDWALGPNAEHAFLSGQAMAEAMLAQVGQTG